MAVPIAAILGAALAMLWTLLDVEWFDGSKGLYLIAWMIGIVVIHEFVHGLIHPGSGASTNSIFGFWPSKLVFYAHYDGILTRKRFIAILLGPFVLLSLAPLLVALVVGAAPFYLAFVSVFNGLAACVDVLGSVLLLATVPAGAQLRNKGWRTYYRMVEQG